MNTKIVVSIVCITYNHAPYIRQCLDGFVMQKTSFPFEVLIHDDASTDGTTEIVREYADKYPDIFVPFYEEQNQWGKLSYWKNILFPKVRGKYVALCEGDDYWTDPIKLQKQVDTLEANPAASVCFHSVVLHWEDGEEQDTVIPTSKHRFNKFVLNIDDLLRRNCIQTNSVMYRWRFHEDDLSVIPDGIICEDYFMHLVHAEKGEIIFLPECMGVYRKQKSGIWYGAEASKDWCKKNAIRHYKFYDMLERRYNANFSIRKDTFISTCYAYALRDDDKEWLDELRNTAPLPITIHKFMRAELFLIKIATILARASWKERLIVRKRNLKNFLRIYHG